MQQSKKRSSNIKTKTMHINKSNCTEIIVLRLVAYRVGPFRRFRVQSKLTVGDSRLVEVAVQREILGEVSTKMEVSHKGGVAGPGCFTYSALWSFLSGMLSVNRIWERKWKSVYAYNSTVLLLFRKGGFYCLGMDGRADVHAEQLTLLNTKVVYVS